MFQLLAIAADIRAERAKIAQKEKGEAKQKALALIRKSSAMDFLD